VNIPIVPKNSEWKLFMIQSIPYAWGNQTCHLQLSTTVVAVNGNEIIPFEERDLDECVTGSDFLCRLQEFGMKATKQMSCIKKLIGGAPIKDLQQICKIDCHKKWRQS